MAAAEVGEVTDAPGTRRKAIGGLWDLVLATVRICLRYRVTGLAAEAGFFAILSMPPLVLGLAATAGWIGSGLGHDTREQLVDGIQTLAAPFLTENVVSTIILPTFNDAIERPRLDLISLGFVLSLWSGSRALNVYLDTISIMYGLGGRRGILRARALSFGLYALTMTLAAVTVPLVVLGPSVIEQALPSRLSWLLSLYWPAVTVAGISMLATLYHVATPIRAGWRRNLGGAALAFAIWLLASVVMREVVSRSVGGTSVYGPLATPIIVMMWLYLVAIAVLIGAGLNAAIEELWPDPRRAQALAAADAQVQTSGGI